MELAIIEAPTYCSPSVGLQSGQHSGSISQNREYRQYSPKIMDPMLPILSVLGNWAIIFGHFGGPEKLDCCQGP